MNHTKTMAPALAAITSFFTGCIGGLNPIPISGSGNATALTTTATDFTAVSVDNACAVTIRKGDSHSVTIIIDDNLADYVKVEQDGATLGIRLEPGRFYTNYDFAADITMPDVEGLDANGASSIDVSGFASDRDMAMALAGGSKITGDLSCGDLAVTASGGSAATLTGSATDLALEASGGSRALLSELTVTGAKINLSGGSKAEVNVSGTITGNLSGGSQVQYTGTPALGTISKSGGSSVRAL